MAGPAAPQASQRSDVVFLRRGEALAQLAHSSWRRWAGSGPLLALLRCPVLADRRRLLSSGDVHFRSVAAIGANLLGNLPLCLADDDRVPQIRRTRTHGLTVLLRPRLSAVQRAATADLLR